MRPRIPPAERRGKVPKLKLQDLDVKGKRVLVRVDFNVPLSDDGKSVADDTRIRASLPTIEHLIDGGARVLLMSHLGRPKGKPNPKMSLIPAAERLGELLGRPVATAPDCVGEAVEKTASSLKDGDAMLLENLRFHPEEEKNDAEFAKSLAALGELYVNDAFGTSHRAHASVEGVTHHFEKCAAGFLLQKEIEAFEKALGSPEKPFLAILGGVKVSDKIGVIESLLAKVDALAVGGAMAYTFLKAEGVPVGASKVEDDKLDLAKSLLGKASLRGVKLLLPEDHVAASEFKADAESRVVPRDGIPEGWMGVDVGPKTVEAFKQQIASAKTIVWNGPLGVFEMEPFSKGTFEVARAVAASGAASIVGGGDSVAALNRSGVAEKITHISTGGGASLELLEGKVLPGIAALTDRAMTLVEAKSYFLKEAGHIRKICDDGTPWGFLCAAAMLDYLTRMTHGKETNAEDYKDFVKSYLAKVRPGYENFRYRCGKDDLPAQMYHVLRCGLVHSFSMFPDNKGRKKGARERSIALCHRKEIVQDPSLKHLGNYSKGKVKDAALLVAEDFAEDIYQLVKMIFKTAEQDADLKKNIELCLNQFPPLTGGF